jgi:hypothetical protein
MTRITLDAGTVAKLRRLNDLVEIRDEAGHILGHFHPLLVPRDSEGKIISPISDEEMEQLRKERTGRSLKEILADLQKL